MRKLLFLLFSLSQWLAFSQSINLNGNLGAVTTCNSSFYDSGGSTGNYQDNENYSVTFYPSGNGSIQITFSSFDTEYYYDSLYVYNGNTVNPANLIGTYNGTLNPFSITATNPTGCLTLVWKTDFAIVKAGWEATINCVAPPINVSSMVNPSVCNAATGSINLNVSGGIAPYTFAWSNGATTQNINNLSAGAYIVLIADSIGNTFADTFYINASNLVINPTISAANCDSTGGSISLAMSGGTAPYNVSWSNGLTGSLLSNAGPNGYNALVTDANGCLAYWAGAVSLQDSCTATISGYIYNDINGNCVQDAGENALASTFVNITPGGGTFTDANGYYAFEVVPGTYNIQCYPTPFMATSACGNGFNQQIALPNFGMNALNTNFPIQLITVQDLSVSLYENAYVPGANHTTNIHYENNSSMAMTPTITWQHSSLITPTTYSVPPTTYNALTHTATWNLPTIPSLSDGYVYITSITDSTANIGDTATSNVQIMPIVGDNYPLNNQYNNAKAVVAAFDPNQKTAYPQGEGAYHFISPNQNTLHYTIDFQNTGTYPATYVELRDTLDAALNAFSVEPLMASHDYTLDLVNDNILVFRFFNINLPDSFSNEPASHGFVTFNININAGLPLGTTIHNTAAIYFDFNEAVITNTTLHTIYLPPAITDLSPSEICEGYDATAQVSNGVAPYTFSWSNGIVENNNTSGNSTVLFTGIGTYTVSVTDSYGLVSNIDSLSVTQVPSDASFTANIVGDTLFLVPNTIINAAYGWDFGNGQSSADLYPYLIITEPEYTITLYVENMCGMVDSYQTIMTTATENAYQGKIELFPNPMTTQTALQVDFPTQKPYNVELTDITGKVLRSWENVTGDNLIIQREMLPSGTYFVQVKGTANFVEKLLVR